MKIRWVAIFCLQHLMTTLVLAQDFILDTVYLKPVYIKVDKPLKERGLTKTTIDTVVIKESLDASLSDVLSHHSPVFIKTYGQGALATASFRGTAASHTQVEWNGMNINSPMLGQVDFSLVPIYFVDEIELLHGGSSLQTGSGALGGSILINSKPDWDTSLHATVIQTAASFDTYQSFVKVGGGKGKLFFDLRAYHEQSQNDFLFYNNANGLWNYERQPNADYVKNGGLINLWYRLNSSNTFSLHAWGQVADRNLPPIMSYQGNGREEYQNDKEFRVSGKWKNNGEKYKAVFSTGFTNTSLNYLLANQTPLGVFINYDSESGIQSNYNKYELVNYLSSKTVLTTLLNYNFHYVSIFDNRELTGYDASRNELGASIKIAREVSKRLASFGLIRLDYIDWKLTPVMPSIGLEYQLLKKTPLNLTSNFTRNYHQPTLNDLYWLPGGNLDLRPEQGYTGDLAIKYTLNRDSSFYLNTSLGTYYSRIEDWIIWRPGEFRYWQADNLKKVYARGIEYSLLTKGVIKQFHWGVSTNLTYTKTTNEEETLPGDNSVGKQLIYIPLYKCNLMADLNYKKITLNYNIAYTSERYTTSSNEATRHTLPAYTIHNVSIAKQLKVFKRRVNLQFKINNLFSVDYQAILWRAMPRRNYKLLLKVEF